MAALRLGAAQGWFVDALHVRPDPAMIAPILGDGLAPGALQGAMDASTAAIQANAEAARATFDDAARACNASIIQTAPERAGFGARYTEGIGARERVVASRARLADVVVFASEACALAGALSDAFAETVLNERRPAFLAPSGAAGVGEIETVFIAWDGSGEAAAALRSALAFVRGAGRVVIGHVVRDGEEAAKRVCAELEEYLTLQGCKSETVLLEGEGRSIAQTLIEGAQLSGAQLLVMGAYGHSRLREWVLGGVTQRMIVDAPFSLFLAH